MTTSGGVFEEFVMVVDVTGTGCEVDVMIVDVTGKCGEEVECNT